MRFFLIACPLAASLTAARAQQYPAFTQYYFNELVINPAYAGNPVRLSATAMYRNQWINFPGAPRTMSISAHTALRQNKVGVGMIVDRDEIGSYKNDHIYAAYAYKIHLARATLAMGLQAGANVLRVDFDNLHLSHPADQSFLNAANTVRPNFGAGLFLSTSNGFLGFSAPFILTNNVATTAGRGGEVKEARYYFLRAGTVRPLSRAGNVKANPSVLLHIQEGQPLSFDLNASFIFDDVLSTGVSYRLGNSFTLFIDMALSEKIHFAYSYGIPSSSFTGLANGTYEFMLNFRSIIRGIHKDPECPSYFSYWQKKTSTQKRKYRHRRRYRAFR